jgi:hypothetical protein
MMLLPILRHLKHGLEREKLERRADLARRIKEREKARKLADKELAREARLYEQILIARWTQLGEAHLSRNADLATGGRPVHRPKIQHVKFERCFTTPERIYFKIAINKRRSIVGKLKNVLPYQVMVKDLLHPDTLHELSHACRRVVEGRHDDPRKGAWVIVNRLEGVDGIPAYVSFKDMLPHFPADVSKGPVCLGIGEHREPHMVSLATHPHILIGGTTQGGKSNWINAFIASLMRFCDPEELKFVLIDLKRMEFNLFEEAPHLMRPVVFDAEVAVQILTEMVDEVRRRIDLLSAGKAKELSAWNRKYPKRRMPRIVIVVDEFAELMVASGRKIAQQTAILTTRLTNLGRAVGIHLVIATQRPAVAVVPGAIKMNMPLIISARVPSHHQSTVILGVKDAALLPLHPGRMAYLSSSSVHAIQTAHCTEDDIVEAVRIARGRQARVIKLDGYEPVIDPPGLICYIADAMRGHLAGQKIWNHLRDLGVPARGLKSFLADIIRHEEIEANGRTFEIVREGQSWRLSEIRRPDVVVEPFEQRFPGLPPAPIILALPAPKPEPAPARPEPEPLLPPDEDEIMDRWIRDKCVVSKASHTIAKPLYLSYRASCLEYGAEPLSMQLWAKKLKERGFKNRTQTRGPHKGNRRWDGISLLSQEVEDGLEKTANTSVA